MTRKTAIDVRQYAMESHAADRACGLDGLLVWLPYNEGQLVESNSILSDSEVERILGSTCDEHVLHQKISLQGCAAAVYRQSASFAA